MAESFTKGEVTVYNYDPSGGKGAKIATVLPALLLGGLAIHDPVDGPNYPNGKPHNCKHITHVASGMRCTNPVTGIKAAKRLVVELLKITDWTVDQSAIIRWAQENGMVEKMIEARKAARVD